MPERPLPDPSSDVVSSLLGGSRQRALYGLLFRRQSNPPTEQEMRYLLENVSGEAPLSIDQVLDPIRDHFMVQETGDTPPRYRLTGWRSVEQSAAQQPIPLSLRAEVLAPERCAQCGRRPIEDGVKLSPAQKLPLSWGGTAERENLEPLCEDCMVGREQYFAKWEHAVDKIRAAVGHAEPQVRLGELLRAMAPEWVPGNLLEAVACAQEYQDDWQRRLRDLRFLGWDYEHQNRYDEGARVRPYYRLKQAAPWPDNVPAAIRIEAQRRRAAKGSAGDGA